MMPPEPMVVGVKGAGVAAAAICRTGWGAGCCTGAATGTATGTTCAAPR